MAYVPTNWASGDVVTAAKLNNIEGGVAGAANPFIVNITLTGETSGTADKTDAQILAAMEAGRQVWVHGIFGDQEAYILLNARSYLGSNKALGGICGGIVSGAVVLYYVYTVYNASPDNTEWCINILPLGSA